MLIILNCWTTPDSSNISVNGEYANDISSYMLKLITAFFWLLSVHLEAAGTRTLP